MMARSIAMFMASAGCMPRLLSDAVAVHLYNAGRTLGDL